MLVLGAFGTPKDENIEILGSAADRSLRNGHASVVIIKPSSYRIDESAGRTFVVATDHSDASKSAFVLLMRHVVDPNDTVYVVRRAPGQLYGQRRPTHGLTLASFPARMCQVHAANAGRGMLDTRLKSYQKEIERCHVKGGIHFIPVGWNSGEGPGCARRVFHSPVVCQPLFLT